MLETVADLGGFQGFDLGFDRTPLWLDQLTKQV